jgi:polyhydroxyalkanoate synthesis regulator phasin
LAAIDREERMLEDVRRGVRSVVEAGVSAVSGALTPTRARELARSIAQGQGVEQINRVAQDLLEWSQRSREWIAESVQREVKRQLGAAGIATREDLDALRKRVRELERALGKPGPSSNRSRSLGTNRSTASASERIVVLGGPEAGTGDPSSEAGSGDPSSEAGVADPSPPGS